MCKTIQACKCCPEDCGMPLQQQHCAYHREAHVLLARWQASSCRPHSQHTRAADIRYTNNGPTRCCLEVHVVSGCSNIQQILWKPKSCLHDGRLPPVLGMCDRKTRTCATLLRLSGARAYKTRLSVVPRKLRVSYV